MKPSPLIVGNEENPVDFEWNCEKGIAFHCRKVLEEFWKANCISILSNFRITAPQAVFDVSQLKK